MASRFPEADLTKLKRVSIHDRGGLVRVEDFVDPYDPGEEIDGLFSVIPELLAGADLRAAIEAIAGSAKAGGSVLVMFGAHLVKCGLSRLLVDLMERGIVTAVATNGAGAIHDFEIAMWGVTSEDVAKNLEDGSFGMCRETADHMNAAATRAAERRIGLGEALGESLARESAANRDASILARAHDLGIPATVHVAMGTDIVHEHPSADGAAIGASTLRDFRVLAGVVGGLEGGCVLNVGSAVVLPEVFLKCVAVARNLGAPVRSFTAVGMDMNAPYRAIRNVVERPTAQSGTGIALRGRHELLFPILWAGLVRAFERGS